jgi:predicted phage tail component-like protein
MLNYKGISSDGKLKVLKVTRSVLPPSSNKLMEIDGRSGALFVSKKHGVKKIEVEIAILGDYVNKKREIADWLDADKPEALILSDEPNMTDFAILDGETDMDEILDNGMGKLSFICPDPYSFGGERSVSLFTGDDSIFSGGTAPSYATFTFNIPSTMSSVKFETTDGDFFEVKDSFVAGDVLVIDMGKGKVTKNGTLIMSKVTLESDFFPLKAGTTSFTGTTVQGSVRFIERFK